MNYLVNKKGVVGQYKGCEVYVLHYRDLTLERTRGHIDTIYAVTNFLDDKNKAALVLNGDWIGTMTDAGQIDIFKHIKNFNFWKKKTEKFVEEKRVEDKDISIPAPVSVKEVVYETTVVDNFFKGLKDFWKELDKNLMEGRV